jgi:eukaryotic-like serine/threonine-protein kinase
VSPRTLNPAIDFDLDLIVMKCLQKPPELRYATAQALADDLGAYLASESIAARRLQLADLVAVLFQDTCHAQVLENWGQLWMRHGIFLAVLGIATSGLQLAGVTSRAPYFVLWMPLLGVWAALFWRARQLMGPITFVERQLFHIWAGSVIGNGLTLVLEAMMGLPVLALAPTIAVVSGSTFLCKAGLITGEFYVQAGALYATAFAMVLFPTAGMALFGIVSGLCFFVPGWRYRNSKA